MHIFKYLIKTPEAEYYCKITEYDMRDKLSYTIAFGGLNAFCFMASLTQSNTQNDEVKIVPHIDRIDLDEKCVKEGIMTSTVSLVKAALWTMKYLIGSIDRLTLMDDSHIDCIKGSKMHRLSLKYDYLVKHNQTWYEKQFGARLPDELWETYKKSLEVLDMPLNPYNMEVDRFPNIEKYKDIYNASNTPRTFINNLRVRYNNEYCIEVGGWLSGYMRYLGIKVYEMDWYIEADSIQKPAGFEIYKTDAPIRGGSKRKTRRRRSPRYVSSVVSEY
jgi:hypothetical protein